MPFGQQLGIAHEHATKRVPSARASQTAGEVRRALVGRHFDSAGDIAVLDGTGLAGLLPLEDLLAAGEAVHIGDLMDARPPVMAPGADQEAVAWEMVRRGESSVALVDEDGRFAGLVPPHRMLGVLLAEHDEDVARFAGYLSSTKELGRPPRNRCSGGSGTGCRGC